MSIFSKKDRLDKRLGSRIYWQGSFEEIKDAVEKGANLDGTYEYDYSKHSVIFWAANMRDEAVVEFLLSKGAKPDNDYDVTRQETALLQAVSQKKAAIVKLLLKYKANPEQKNRYGNTAIVNAASAGDATIVQALVEAGANINAQSSDGNTALHYAAAQGHANLVRYLLDKGADTSITNANMNRAADVAESTYPRIAAMIRGENPDAISAKPAPPPPAEEGWKLTAQQEVARIIERPTIGYRLTEIFNFEARLYTQLARNLETGAESQTVKGFSELDDGRAVEAAHNALVRLGGTPAPFDKKKLQAPGQS